MQPKIMHRRNWLRLVLVGMIFVFNPAFESLESRMLDALRGHFRPEFLNRIDDIVIFDRIDASRMKEIVAVQIETIIRQLKLQKDITLSLDESVRDQLAQDGYDPAFGARPLKRLIQRRLLDPLALEIINGTVKHGASIAASLDDKSNVVFTLQDKA
jgi:ATP-dependent Clp protease ATP-binding subunit ClpB